MLDLLCLVAVLLLAGLGALRGALRSALLLAASALAWASGLLFGEAIGPEVGPILGVPPFLAPMAGRAVAGLAGLLAGLVAGGIVAGIVARLRAGAPRRPPTVASRLIGALMGAALGLVLAAVLAVGLVLVHTLEPARFPGARATVAGRLAEGPAESVLAAVFEGLLGNPAVAERLARVVFEPPVPGRPPGLDARMALLMAEPQVRDAMARLARDKAAAALLADPGLRGHLEAGDVRGMVADPAFEDLMRHVRSAFSAPKPR